MNATVNKFLLAEDKFMPEMLLKQSRFTYSTCRQQKKNTKIQGKRRHQIHLSKRTGQGLFLSQCSL